MVWTTLIYGQLCDFDHSVFLVFFSVFFFFLMRKQGTFRIMQHLRREKRKTYFIAAVENCANEAASLSFEAVG